MQQCDDKFRITQTRQIGTVQRVIDPSAADGIDYYSFVNRGRQVHCIREETWGAATDNTSQSNSPYFFMGKLLETMFDRRDFVLKTLSVGWLNRVQSDSFDSAIAAANEWIEAESIEVLNIEAVVLPTSVIVSDEETESPRMIRASGHE